MLLYKICHENDFRDTVQNGIKPDRRFGTDMVILSDNPTAIPVLTPRGFDDDDHEILYDIPIEIAQEANPPTHPEWWIRITFSVPDWELGHWLTWAAGALQAEYIDQSADLVGGREFLFSVWFTTEPVLPNQIEKVERLDDPKVWTDITDSVLGEVSHG